MVWVAEVAAAKYGPKTVDIIVELGPSPMVGWQGDMIVEVALDLRRRRRSFRVCAGRRYADAEPIGTAVAPCRIPRLRWHRRSERAVQVATLGDERFGDEMRAAGVASGSRLKFEQSRCGPWHQGSRLVTELWPQPVAQPTLGLALVARTYAA